MPRKPTKRTRTNREIGGQVFQRGGREGPAFPWFIRYTRTATAAEIAATGGPAPAKAPKVRVCKMAMVPVSAEPGAALRPAANAVEAEDALRAATKADEVVRPAASGVTLDDFRPLTTKELEELAKAGKADPFAGQRYAPKGKSDRHARNVAAQIEQAARPDAGESGGGNLGRYAMNRVGREQARAYVAALKAGGVGANTQRHHLAALSGCWRVAIERGFATENPWKQKGIGLDKVATPTIRFRSAAEIAKMIAKCPAQIRPLLRFIAATGCRYAEAAYLTWDEVVAADLVTIQPDRTKTGTVRHIRIEGDARAVLDERRASRVVPLSGPDYVFALHPATKTKPAKPYSHGYAFKILAEALDAAKIPSERPFHTLRNSLASRMVLAGVPLSVVAEAIGDSLATTARHYGHLTPGDAVARAYASLATPRRRARAAQA